MYTLKTATIDDLDFAYYLKKVTLKKYIEEIWGWDDAYQRSETLNSLELGDTKIILVENQAVGIFETNENHNTCNIVEIELMPAYQKRGIGKMLISQYVETCYVHHKNVDIGCFKNNNTAIELYKKLGFIIYEETATHFLMRYEPLRV